MSFNRDFFSDAFNSSAEDFFRDREDFRRSRRPDMTRFMDSPFSSMGFSGRPSAMNGFRDSRLPGGMFAGSEIPIPVIRQRRRNTDDCGDHCDDYSEHDAKQMEPNDSNTTTAADDLINQDESKHEAKIQPRVHHIPIKVETRDEAPASSASPIFTSGTAAAPHPPLSRSSSNASQASARSSSSGHSLYHNQHRSESPFSSTSSVHQRVASPSMHSPVSNCSAASGEEHIIPIKIERGVEPIRKQTCTSTSPLPKAAKQAKSASPSPGLTQSTRSHRTPTPTAQSREPGPYVTRIDVQEEGGEEGPVYERKAPSRSAPVAQDSMKLIAEINKEISALEAQINSFTGEHQDKQYRYLDEMLTRCMLKLDSIEVEGRDDVRHARKAALSTIDKCLNILDSKAAKNNLQEEKMDTIDDQEQQQHAGQQTMVNTIEKDSMTEQTGNVTSTNATAISGEETDEKRNLSDQAMTDGQQVSGGDFKSSDNSNTETAADEDDKEKIFESSV